MKNLKWLIIGATVFAGVTGCGKSNSPMLPPIASLPGAVNGCPVGQISIGGAPCQSGDFQTVCATSGGWLTYVNGQQLCRVVKNLGYYSLSNYGYFPRLSPDNPHGGMNTGISVRRGDTLSYSGSGGWGGTEGEIKTLLGGLIWYGTYNTHCSEVSATGMQGSTPLSYLGLPAGLVASDGMEVFLLGHSVTRTINNDGVLSIGFNTPVGTGSCSNMVINQLTITHCQDSLGTTYPCP